ncbi:MULTISPECIES: Zn-ribbon domain-containing OB-fold protein [Bacillus]|uniref:Zn-ribbon domain-containing OB-fold protein n=1 Tax=Bacillus TaxID=1386 RepID=UPI000310B2DA|nr:MULTISPECIES: OB-fold domain-containing protein [Bacillus]
MSYQKPIPVKTPDNQPYWDAADRHELVLQKCETCQSYNHPPGPACAKCGSTELSWESQGSDIKGTLYSYVVSYRPFLPGFQDDLPTIIAVVQLDNLPEVKIIGNVLECSPQELQVGMPVKMIWQDITEDRALPQWIQA